MKKIKLADLVMEKLNSLPEEEREEIMLSLYDFIKKNNGVQ